MTAGGALQIALAVCVFAALFAGVTKYVELVAWWDRAALRRAPVHVPVIRPIEDVARDARRLGRRYHSPAAGTRFAKLEGLRRAYDAVLAEACCSLEVDHLLGVLAPGPELDAERRRVETVLSAWGMDLDVADTSGR